MMVYEYEHVRMCEGVCVSMVICYQQLNLDMTTVNRNSSSCQVMITMEERPDRVQYCHPSTTQHKRQVGGTQLFHCPESRSVCL